MATPHIGEHKKRETVFESWWTLLWCLWRPPSLPDLFPLGFLSRHWRCHVRTTLQTDSQHSVVHHERAPSQELERDRYSPLYRELYRRRGPRWWRPLPTQSLLSACSQSTLSPETSRRPRASPTLPLFPSSTGSVLPNFCSIFLVVSEVTVTPCGWRSSLFPCSEQVRVSVFCFLVAQWIHIMRQSLGAFVCFPNPSPVSSAPSTTISFCLFFDLCVLFCECSSSVPQM